MAEQRALVLIDGQIQELPIGDTLAGAGGGATPGADLVGAKLTLTTDLNIPESIDTLITFASTQFDTGPFWNVSNPTRITIPTGVTYVEVVVSLASRMIQAGTADYIVRLKKNGVEFQAYIIDNQFWGPPPISSGVLPVIAGDYIQVEVWCTEQWELSSSSSFVTVKSATGVQGEPGPMAEMVQTQITATAHTLDNTDLAGNVIRRMNNASTITVTVAPDLTGTEPVTFIRTGAGAVTFVAGAEVTLLSAGGNRSIADQYGSATLIPDSTTPNTYYLIGNLTT